jgi:asparagine synthase (glutamine-hydrolysing)
MRFPHLEDSVEDEWQERVVRHLGLTDWQIIEPGPGLGFLGSVAVDVLETSGLVWPPNAHFMMPSVRSAAGGSVLTGAFGDEIFTEDPRRSSARRSRYESLPRSLRDVARVAVTAGPRRVRSWDARRRLRVLPLPVWLTDQAGDTVRTGLADLAAVAPLRWDHAAITFPRLRYQNAGVAALEALGSLTDTVVTAPLGDARFVAAVANEAGKLGFTDRTAAMRRLFGHLLPDEVLSRSTKASFGRALWGPEAAEFAEAWDGSGIPEDLAEAEVLRATWRAACDMSAPVPAHAFQSAMALHAAYVVAA